MGTVANVFNFGASDLLEVMLASDDRQDQSSSSKLDSTSCGRHVWVPFVEAIVPEVDMDKREMLITPPKGLLELNLRSDMRPKKERRQLVRSAPFYCYLRIRLSFTLILITVQKEKQSYHSGSCCTCYSCLRSCLTNIFQ